MLMFDKDIPTNERNVLKELARKYFVGQPIKLNKRLEGYDINCKGQYRLGLFAGPRMRVSHLAHEMCHFVELEEPRLMSKPTRGWGLVPGTPIYMFGRLVFEPTTDQCTMRELRVWAYQLNLSRMFGIEVDPVDLVSSAVYMPDFCTFQFKRVPEQQRTSLGYRELEEYAIELAAKMVEQMSKEYTFDRFETLWFGRLEKLKQS